MDKFRFPGKFPYEEQDSCVFFGRESETATLLDLIGKNQIVEFVSDSGAGKTSLLRAGIIPALKKSDNCEIFYIDFSQYSDKPIDTFLHLLAQRSAHDTVIDKISRDTTAWNYLKKTRSTKTNPQFVFLFDSIEFLQKHNDQASADFFSALFPLISGEIPHDIRTKIDSVLIENPDLLTEEGKKFLFEKLRVKIVFACNLTFENRFSGLSKNLGIFSRERFYLEYFKASQAEKCLRLPGKYNVKINGASLFNSPEFDFSENTIQLFLNQFSTIKTGGIPPVFIQALGEYAEKMFIEGKTPEIRDEEDINRIFYAFYEKLMFEIPDFDERNMARYIAEEVLFLPHENKKLSIYKGALLSRYQLSDSIYNYLITSRIIIENSAERDEVYISLYSEAWIPVVAEARQKRLQLEQLSRERLAEAEKLRIKAEYQMKKARKTKRIAILVLSAFFLTLIAVFILNKARKDARQSEFFALSNLYAYNAFKETENNPTLGFRLAEKACKLAPENPMARGALITAYYSAEAFYSTEFFLEKNTNLAWFSPDKSKIAEIISEAENQIFLLVIKDLKGKERIRIQHENQIISAGITPDEKIITLTDVFGNVLFFNSEGKEFRRFKASNSIVWLCKFSPDMDAFVTTDAEGKIKLWKASSELIKEFKKHDFDVYSVDYSPDGNFFVTADEFTVNLFDKKGNFIRQIPLPTKNSYYFPLIQSVRFSNNSDKILISLNDRIGRNHMAWLTDLTGFNQMVFRGHTDWINSAEFSPDDSRIITSSRDKTVRVWKSTGEPVGILSGHTANVFDAQFSGNSNTVISCSEDKTVRRWQFGRLLNPLAEMPEADWAQLSPDGLKILAISRNEVLIKDFTGTNLSKFAINEKSINYAAFTEAGKNILLTTKEGKIDVYDLNGIKKYNFSGHHAQIKSIDFLPDSSKMLSAADDSVVIVWNYKTRIPESVFRMKGSAISAYFIPKTRLIAFFDNIGNMTIADFETKKIEKQIQLENGCILTDFSKNANMFLIVGRDKKLSFFDTNASQISKPGFARFSCAEACFSPAGKNILISTSDRFMRLTNLKGKEILKIETEGIANKTDFSLDSRYIVSIIENGKTRNAKLWVIDPEKILELTNTIKIFGNFEHFSDEILSNYSD